MINLYVVRHGTTEYNKKSITMGHVDSPLTGDAVENIKVLIDKLKDIDIDYIYASDLGRAQKTATVIANSLSIEKVIPSKDLREINYGVFANRKKDEVKKECPEYKTKADFVFPEGESYYQMQLRVIKFINSIEKNHHKNNILLVVHSGVIRAIYTYFHNLDFQHHLKKNFLMNI